MLSISLGVAALAASSSALASCGTSSDALNYTVTGTTTTDATPCWLSALPSDSSVTIAQGAGFNVNGNPGIDSTAAWAIWSNSNTRSSGITNNGTITVTGGQARGIGTGMDSVVNGGISNTGTINADGHGIEVGYERAGTVNANADGVAIFNSGTISTNPGSLFADSSAIRVARGSQINGDIVNSGTLDGAVYGLNINNKGARTAPTSVTGVVSNTAGASMSGAGAGIINSGVLAGGVDNAGTISSSQGYGIWNTASTDSTNTPAAQGGRIGAINNTAGASISGNEVGLFNEGTIASLNNAGTITGSDGPAILNTGTITGGVVNSGTLNGDVMLGSAGLTLTGDRGQIVGDTTATGITVNGSFSAGGDANSTTGLTVDAGGDLTVGNAHQWTAMDSVAVGDSLGEGTLRVTSGASVAAPTVNVGHAPGSNGTVIVTGAQSALEAGELNLGDAAGGTGSMTLADGGTLRLTGTPAALSLGETAGSTATLNIGAAANQAAAAAGILESDQLVFGEGAGTLVFNHTDTGYRFAPSMTGAGRIDALAGTTILTGDSSSFSGTTTIDQGAIVQVGDGGTIGAFAGTVANAGELAFNRSDDTAFSGTVSGTGVISKDGAGSLALANSNSYTGGTRLNNGRLDVGTGSSLGSGTLTMANGTTLGFLADGLNLANAIVLGDSGEQVIDTGSFNETLGGAISGPGGLTKQGTGVLTTTGANRYSGATNIAGGTLRAGARNTFSANSSHTLAAGTLLDLAGYDQTIAALSNAGTVKLGADTAGTTLNVSGDYTGNGGTLVLNSVLGDSTSLTDRLVVGGNVDGNTTMQVVNLGGLGALTIGDGIEVVDVAGTSTSNAFALAGTHVDAGAYEYYLYRGGANGSGEDWYLRSSSETGEVGGTPIVGGGGTPIGGGGGTPIGSGGGTPIGDGGGTPIDNGGGGQVVAYRPEVALHAALPAQLRQADMTMLGNLHQRVGETPEVQGGTNSDGMSWGRLIGGSTDLQQQGTVGQHSSGQAGGVQVGSDLWQQGGWRAGLYLSTLSSTYDVSGYASGRYGSVGSSRIRSYALGAYGTWTGTNASYVDVVVQQGWHRTNVESVSSVSRGEADATLASVEVGKPFALGASVWKIEPQAQAVYQHLSIDPSELSGATTVSQHGGSGWLYRVGVRFHGDYGSFQPYVRGNLYHASAGNDITTFSTAAASTAIYSHSSYSASELAAGMTYSLNPQAQVYMEAGHVFGSNRDDTRLSSPLQGSLGLRIRW